MIKAIETNYKGYRFRSRLEARWAVAFDALGIKWEYEAQGFMCTYRVSLRDWTETPGPGVGGMARHTEFPYLPDFWLPDEDLFVEVKGHLTRPEHLDVMDRAGSLCDRTNTRLVLLGPIPAQGEPPSAMHMRKGCLYISPALIGGAVDDGHYNWDTQSCIAHDVGGDWARVTGERCADGWSDRTTGYLNDPLNFSRWLGLGSPRLLTAYMAARSARFEHGERG